MGEILLIPAITAGLQGPRFNSIVLVPPCQTQKDPTYHIGSQLKPDDGMMAKMRLRSALPGGNPQIRNLPSGPTSDSTAWNLVSSGESYWLTVGHP
jgi:hypothetical protein